MQKPAILLGSLIALFGTWSSARAQCVPMFGPAGQAQAVCGDFRPLRIGSAVLNGPPLIWSPETAALALPPVYGRPRIVGRTIPIEEVIGRRVLPLRRLPQTVIYNSPESFPGAADPGFVLMPLLPPRRPIKLEGVYP